MFLSYCHLQRFHKGIKKGKKVSQGEVIGYVGSTGLATGPHLHYEFMIGNKHTDPVKVKLPSAKPLNKNQQHHLINQRCFYEFFRCDCSFILGLQML